MSTCRTRKALCTGRSAEDDNVLAGAEVQEADFTENAAGLAAHPAPGPGIDVVGILLGEQFDSAGDQFVAGQLQTGGLLGDRVQRGGVERVGHQLHSRG